MTTAPSSPLRLAIIGSGNIANTHAAAIEAIPEVRLQAVCSRNREMAEKLAQPCAARVVGSLEELLAADDIDAVLVATPSGAHADAVLPALRAGKHVLCEKPLEINSERVRAMIDEATRSGVILAGFFPLRQGAGAQTIHQALQAGRFGRLTFISARVKWYRDLEYYRSSKWRGTWALDGGGALMNQGIHAVDLLQWFGGEPTAVAAFADTLTHPGIEVEDTLAATLRFANGALGTLEATTSCYPGLDLSVEVSGERGTAVLVNDRIDLWRFAEELPGDEEVRSGNLGGSIRGGSSDPRAISSEGHRQQIVDFCRAIRGEAAEFISGQEAAKAVAIVETIYRAVRTSRVEPISY
jgi:predicted dehydrogenase